MSIETIEISRIHLDGGTQMRAGINWKVVDEYAALMKEGVKFPAITVFLDTDKTYWLADGFHRLEANRRNGKMNIECNIILGTQRNAILFSTGANSRHGFKLSIAEKKKAAIVLLTDKEWSTWSDPLVAEQVGVAKSTISLLRKQFPRQLDEIIARRKNGKLMKLSHQKGLAAGKELRAHIKKNRDGLTPCFRRLSMYYHDSLGYYSGLENDLDYLSNVISEIRDGLKAKLA